MYQTMTSGFSSDSFSRCDLVESELSKTFFLGGTPGP